MTGLNVLWNSDAGQLTDHFRFLEHLQEKMVVVKCDIRAVF